MNCSDIAELSPLYLSRELPAARLREFETHLERCRSCARELEQQASMDARLRAAVGHEMPGTAALDRSIIRQIGIISARRQRFSRQFIGAAAAIILLMAGSAWWAWHAMATAQGATPRLYTDAARDHQMEVVQHQPRRWRSGLAAMDALAARYGISGAALSALGPAGYKLDHGKICGLEGRPVLHLVYSNGAREVSLYLRRNDSKDRWNLREAVVGREYLDAFQTGRFTAVIVGEGSRSDCLQFARSAAMAL